MNIVSSVQLIPTTSGDIEKKVSGRFNDPEKNFLLVFAPSLPLAISHQLGTLDLEFGIKLCASVLDFYTSGKYRKFKLSGNLLSFDILYLKTAEGITVNVDTKFQNNLANDEDVFQLLNNYIWHVYTELIQEKQFHAHFSVKQCAGVAIAYYLDVLHTAVTKHVIFANQLSWFPELSLEMALVTNSIVEKFGAKYKTDADALATDRDSDRAYKDVAVKFQNLLARLEET